MGGGVTSFVFLLLSAMEFHEHLHSIGTKEGLKERKLQKAVESFTWNITILKVPSAPFLTLLTSQPFPTSFFPLVSAHFPTLCVTSPSRPQRSHISPVRTLHLGEPAAWLLGRRLTGRTHEWLAHCGSCQEGKGPCISPLRCCRLHSCQSLHGKQHRLQRNDWNWKILVPHISFSA